MLAIFKNVHTYYISGIVIAVIGGVYFYHSHPKIEIKTVTTTEIKTVDRVVYVDRVIDRNIVTHTKKTIHRKNGDIITIASNSQDLSKVDTKSQSNSPAPFPSQQEYLYGTGGPSMSPSEAVSQYGTLSGGNTPEQQTLQTRIFAMAALTGSLC